LTSSSFRRAPLVFIVLIYVDYRMSNPPPADSAVLRFIFSEALLQIVKY
jgi:hypothetical protein